MITNQYSKLFHQFNIYIFLIFIFLIPHSGNNSPVKFIFYILFLHIVSIGFVYSIQLMMNQQKTSLWKQNLALITNLLVLSIIVSKFYNFYKYNILELNDFLSAVLVWYIPFFMIKFFSNIRNIRKIYITIMLLVLLNIVDGLFQYIYGFDFVYNNPTAGGRLTAMFSWGTPILGSFLGFFLFIIFYFYEDKKIKLMIWFTIFFIMFILSGSRSMPLSALIGFFLASFFSGKNRRFYIKWEFAFIVLVIVLFSTLFMYISAYLGDNITHRLMSLTGDIWQEQQTKRIATWIQTYYMILDNLFLGVGYGNYKIVLSNYLHYVPYSEGVMPHPHQFHIDFLASTGIISFSLLIGYIYTVFKNTIFTIFNSKYRMINIMIFILIFSPLNVTHGIVSLWWGVVLFIGIGLMYLNKVEFQYEYNKK